jgi:hypothetical protein
MTNSRKTTTMAEIPESLRMGGMGTLGKDRMSIYTRDRRRFSIIIEGLEKLHRRALPVIDPAGRGGAAQGLIR